MDQYLEQTPLLNYNNKEIKQLIHKRNWLKLDTKNRVLSSYNFVRDEIAFGYNIYDNIKASRVLSDGYGQCNTKGTLFMALLRALEIPCRIHGFTIYKPLQKGAMKGLTYKLAPDEILHSWVEVYYDKQWYNLEGFIVDKEYLGQLQKKFSDCNGSFCGYGVSTNDFMNPQIEWDQNDTYIQKEGIARDFGVYNSPDDFYSEHRQMLSPVKAFIYRNLLRHVMNRNVGEIRQGK